LLFLVLLAVAAPASAQAVWGAPVTLSQPGQDANIPQVAVDPNGNAVFVWLRPDATTDCLGFPSSDGCFRVQARARSAAGALSAIQTLSVGGQDAYDPQVAVDQSGNAVVVWARPDGTTGCGGFGCARVQARARSAAGDLSAIQTLSGPGKNAVVPQVAVDTNGNAVFVWYGDGGIQARARSAAGTLSAVQILSAAAQGTGSSEVAVDQSGNAVFVWERNDGTTGCGGAGCSRIVARARSAAGDLSAIQTLSDPGKQAFYPEVAVDPSGNAVFVWQRPDTTTDCGGSGCWRIQTRARSAAGALSATQTLSDPGQDALIPQVAVDQGGDAVFVWSRYDGTTDCGGLPGCSRTQTRARSAAGVLSATQTLSPAARDAALSPQVAVDQSGNAAFVWERLGGGTGCGGSACSIIEARTRSAEGVLGSAQILSALGQHAGAPQVAVDPSGNAVAVWRRLGGGTGCGGGGCHLIQAATGP
jgi:hypothetical protein